MRRGLRICALALSLTLVGANTAHAGIFQRLWELEQRKNQWLMDTFFRRNRPQEQQATYSEPPTNGTTQVNGTPQGPSTPQVQQAPR
jgi:hypothetical protein